jgi:hypothetical protein
VCAFVERQDERVTSVFIFLPFFGHDFLSLNMLICVSLALGKPAFFGRLKIHTFRLYLRAVDCLPACLCACLPITHPSSLHVAYQRPHRRPTYSKATRAVQIALSGPLTNSATPSSRTHALSSQPCPGNYPTAV